jgi:hypothetical protein
MVRDFLEDLDADGRMTQYSLALCFKHGNEIRALYEVANYWISRITVSVKKDSAYGGL